MHQYVSDSPELAQQWSDNNHLTPSQVTLHSHKKCWWTCNKGHLYHATPAKRSAGTGCPYCSGNKVLPGFNDLSTTHPKVTQQWDGAKNGQLTPMDVSAGSNRKVWWICDAGHSFKATVKNRCRRTGCPYCSGNKVLAGFNDLATTHPDKAQQWDIAKNGQLTPMDVSAGSRKKVWWTCDAGHSFSMRIHAYTSQEQHCPLCFCSDSARAQGALVSHSETWKKCSEGHIYFSYERSSGGCPQCDNSTPEKDSTLVALFPDIAAHWDSTRNDIEPDMFFPESTHRAWWICDAGHSYQMPIVDAVRGTLCPVCAGRVLVHGSNDLRTCAPELAKQWDIEKNYPLTPDEVFSRSNKKVWWTCDAGHSWRAYIYSRFYGSGCPHCSPHTSAAEGELYEYIQSLLPSEDAVLAGDRKVIAPHELDIYIPTRNIAIEFNGLYWHSEARGKDKRYHYNKWRACKDRGVQLITVWEDDWCDKKDVIKSMLMHKLGVSQRKHIYARTTTAGEVHLQQARDFCGAHHIQGFVQGSAYLGLYDDTGALIAISIWKRRGTALYLERYCTSEVVVGGMGKLLSAGKRWARSHGCTHIVTFSDHEVSDGGLYQRLGFTPDKELAPDYKYVVDGKRIHKFNYRLKRFKNDSALEYQEGLSERELALLNGLERVWDCGKTRWVMDVN